VKVSLDWLSDFVDLDGLEPDRIADRLTMCTAEVESWHRIKRAVHGIVVGEIIEVEPVAQTGDTLLRKTQVDCGNRRFVTVCGAANCRVGLKSAFAPPGVHLADGQPVEVVELAGHRSEGILCSAKELGWSRWHEGIVELPDHLATGTPLAELIPEEDILLEIDNKSLTHRPDLWGHYAFARELAAIFRRPLRPLPLADLSQFDSLPPVDLVVEDLENCPCYGCLAITVRAGQPSPLVIQRRLHALGQRTFNLMVDLTNYVMGEIAQPMHAFDGDLVREIRVAPLGRHGQFVTLDGQTRELLPEDLLIWDGKKPVALAGVMGGLETEVRPETKRILLESANFKASRIRRTSVRLDLRTESAQRYEKSQPPVNVKIGVARLVQLLQEATSDFQVTSRFTVGGDLAERDRPLELAPGTLEKLAGTSIPLEEAVAILERLGFRAEVFADGRLQVGIPPFRSSKDISIPADIVEEVLRIYGYDNIPAKMPTFPLRPLRRNDQLRLEHRARRLLAAGHGFCEVQTYAWMDDRLLGQLGFEPKNCMVVRNPIAQHSRLLRTTLIPNLLGLVERNRANREEFRLFEIGKVYRLASGGACDERTSLGGISFSTAERRDIQQHFLSVKGALQDLGKLFGGEPLRFRKLVQGQAPWQLADRCLQILQGDRVLGEMGVLEGEIVEAVAPGGGQIVWFELCLDNFLGIIWPAPRYVMPPEFPGSRQDFSLLWNPAEGFAALEAELDQFQHPLILRREFLYVFTGRGLPEGKASYSFRYWIGLADRTITSEDIEGFRQAFLRFLGSRQIILR